MQEWTMQDEERLNQEMDNLVKWQHKNKGFKIDKTAVSPNLVKNWKRTDFCQMHQVFDLVDNGDEVFDLMQNVCDIQNARQCGKKGGFLYTPQFGGLYVEEIGNDDDHKTEFPMWLVEIIEKPTHIIVIVTSKYW